MREQKWKTAEIALQASPAQVVCHGMLALGRACSAILAAWRGMPSDCNPNRTWHDYCCIAAWSQAAVHAAWQLLCQRDGCNFHNAAYDMDA
jgi:hypothetical protein